ncbi:DUF1801 domain-containing protein [Microbacterium deminutum]|uniref:YdhG-like domain-containing protein n=1 Tax=Microbacterium deminutum TaxID=344164 RepID=A0ABN2QRA6_9MICO
MRPTGGNVAEFVAAVTPAKRQRDAATMVELLRELTGREPALWGTIVGFGSCHYAYPTGTEGDMPLAGFAPRRQATTVYLLSTASHGEQLADLGPHETGVSCLYIKDLEAVDLDVLRDVIADDLRRVTAGETPGAEIVVTG